MTAAPKTCAGCSYLRDRDSICFGLFGLWTSPVTIHREFRCVRFPKEVPTQPTRYCGEFVETLTPLGDDTEATRAIAAWEAEHGTNEEILARWRERERQREEYARARRKARIERSMRHQPIQPAGLESRWFLDWLFR